MSSFSAMDCQIQDGSENQCGAEKEENITDPDLQAMMDRANAMQQAAAKLDEAQSIVDRIMDKFSRSAVYSRVEADKRSIYVGNVDYSATGADLQDHFTRSGEMRRITILKNRSGHPKGCAYVEFAEEASVQAAMELDGSLFKGRLIKVNPKRTNIPGRNATRGSRGGTRGTAGTSRGATRGGYRGRGSSSGLSYFQIRPRSDYRFVASKPY